MEPPNFIWKHWEEQKQVFLLCLDQIRKRPVKKVVHDIRVAIKKLRSFIRLSRELPGAENKLLWDPVKKFFRVSGKYHDVEMNLALLKKNTKNEPGKLPSFTKHLRGLISTTRGWTKTAAVGFRESSLEDLSAWLQSRLSGISDEELTDLIRKISIQTLKKIKELFEDFASNAHAIRKLLKLLHYWLPACPVNPLFDKKEMKTMEKVLDDLGNWQDYAVFQKKLKEFRKAWLPKELDEYEVARNLEKRIASIREELLEDARKRLELLVGSL